MGLALGKVLQVVNPLYGIDEAGLHWYLTYRTHHLDVLNMTKYRTDPLWLIQRKDRKRIGVIELKVDDTLGLSNNDFLKEEVVSSKRFETNPRTILSEPPIDFNGFQIEQKDDHIKLTQKNTENLSAPDTKEPINSQCALMQYIAVNTRPDLRELDQLLA